MSNDKWVNDGGVPLLDAEELLKVLSRLADAAERIAENTERPEPGTVAGIERGEYPGTRPPRLVDPPRAMVANFTDVQIRVFRQFLMEVARPELQFGDNQLLMQEIFRRWDGFAARPIDHILREAAGAYEAPMWRIPDGYVIRPPEGGHALPPEIVAGAERIRMTDPGDPMVWPGVQVEGGHALPLIQTWEERGADPAPVEENLPEHRENPGDTGIEPGTLREPDDIPF
jgi:hypothetical protein